MPFLVIFPSFNTFLPPGPRYWRIFTLATIPISSNLFNTVLAPLGNFFLSPFPSRSQRHLGSCL
uniref:Uncharacterized protein n=1 Tax=Arundo donax TaxID=35708 RepID=A0A0A9G542_ARUDO